MRKIEIAGEAMDIHGKPIYSELAEIRVSQIVTKVVHVCPSDSSNPQFEGEVHGTSIKWPVAFGRYPLAYCPWCGLPLPHSIKLKEGK